MEAIIVLARISMIDANGTDAWVTFDSCETDEQATTTFEFQP